MKTGRVEVEVAGLPLSFETGQLAKQASGAVVVRWGESVVLVTATMSSGPREGIDFFPLTCDYEEKMFAAGKIPGGFFKREGRPGERAILTARLMDRPLRPLFPKGFRNDVQVVVDGPEHRPGSHDRRACRHRGRGGARDLADSVGWPDRGRAGGPEGRPVCDQPVAARHRREDPRSRSRGGRDARRDHDGGGRRA